MPYPMSLRRRCVSRAVARPSAARGAGQGWRCRCRRATIASPARSQGSPAGPACAPLACSTEMVMRGRHATRPTCLYQHHVHLPPEPSTMIPRGWTPCGPCTPQGAAHRDAMACTSAAVTTSGRRLGGQGCCTGVDGLPVEDVQEADTTTALFFSEAGSGSAGPTRNQHV